MSYKLNPSSCDRWSTCTASLLYNKTFKISQASVKGSFCHLLGKLYLEQFFYNYENQEQIKKLETEGYFEVDSKGKKINIPYSYEIKKHVEYYVNSVKKLYNINKQAYVIDIKIEEKVFDFKFFNNKVNGIIDILLLCYKDNKLTKICIYDFKSGNSKVEIKFNKQLFLYILGVLQKNNINNKELYIETGIIQENNTIGYNYTINELKSFRQQFAVVMEEINTNNLQYRPSSKACVFCDHKPLCDARAAAGIK